MRNWSVDTSQFDPHSEEYEIWRLEQLINYGLNKGEKLEKSQLTKHWGQLEIDPDKRRFLTFILNRA